MEGVGRAGRGALAPLHSPAALTNGRRFFVNLLCGVPRFRRDRLCRSICGGHDGVESEFIGGRRFGDASTQSEEGEMRRSAPQILDALRYKLKQAKATSVIL